MIHFLKYNLIGILNTVITLITVWILHQTLNWNLELSNFLGFVVGGLNSYLCNRIWNFKSQNTKRNEIARFLIVFGLAYFINLIVLKSVLYALTNWQALSNFTLWISQWMKPGFFAHIIANVVYILISFLLYKNWVFKKQKTS
ncbi:MAG TPA: GtrA family protein [Fibrobacter sp.]|nr:GtrA family protein [Fibrobacter sp.]